MRNDSTDEGKTQSLRSHSLDIRRLSQTRSGAQPTLNSIAAGGLWESPNNTCNLSGGFEWTLPLARRLYEWESTFLRFSINPVPCRQISPGFPNAELPYTMYFLYASLQSTAEECSASSLFRANWCTTYVCTGVDVARFRIQTGRDWVPPIPGIPRVGRRHKLETPHCSATLWLKDELSAAACSYPEGPLSPRER